MNKKILITIIILLALLIGGYFMKNFLSDLFVVKNKQIKLDKTFQLKIGQTALLKKGEELLRIKFLDVAEDFRCPKEVLCSKHNEAIIVADMSVRKNLLDLQKEQIKKVQLKNGENIITLQNYFIKLIQVEPYPKQNQEIKKENYVVSFVVSLNKKMEVYNNNEQKVVENNVKIEKNIELVVVFKKDISFEKADKIMKQTHFDYRQGSDLSRDKIYSQNTGPKFIVDFIKFSSNSKDMKDRFINKYKAIPEIYEMYQADWRIIEN
ncbi:hypothetical protein CVV26_02900 [Candidatus Kuenenbacteria bacterium HGW-Kuenenbacteria-1]|uniref:Uncharacterized protein n=1 Tax=Candidatus Kuenenbacteria bacterium HGW-Kuenenbacteria-1 TaxID=2013812 RepID=A0A2N1UMX4_9BACT|nr:MAG: hypothetical protein CVV26_02900 [Candidatus Kuenenbacteria bacterium HGW-Kuenenbacteria-1]